VGVLINDVVNFERNPLILILDDFYVIRNPIVLETLDYLIDHLPENLHLVIATRYDPPLSLPRLRARGRLTEFRSTNLRFSLAEVSLYMDQQLGVELSPESIARLDNRTEGWAAVLRLLATSLGRMADPSERHVFVNRLPLEESYIFDFLAAEILNQQEPQHRNFLLTTSILPELSYSLCQDVTEQQNAAETLDELFQNNLVQIVVQPTTDESSPSYRYHELLADFLSRQLEREYTREEIYQLHNRAAEAQPGTPSSINHYLKAEQWDEAAQTIQQIGQQMIFMGLYDTVHTWITALPQHTIDRHPQLDYYLGISAFQRGEFDEAQKFVTRALAGYEASGDEIKMGEAILILGAIASGFHDVDRGRQLLEQALSYPLTPHLKIMAHINHAWVGVYSNDWELVEKNVTTAISLALKLEESNAFNILAPHLTAVLLFMPKGVYYLKEYCTRVLAWFGDGVGLVQTGANALMGVIHLMEGEIQKGRGELERARKDSDQLGGFVWLDIGIDFGLLQYAVIQADYNRFEGYWQSRLSHYEQVGGAREYLASFLFIQGRALWCQDRIKEAHEIYERMLAIESPQDIPESHLARALMSAMLMMSQKQYLQAQAVLRQVANQHEQAPHSVLLGNARTLLASLYLKMNHPEDALAELRMLLAEYERKDMLGLLLTEGPDIIPVLKFAIEKDVCVEQANWLLRKLGKDGKFQPMLISTTGETLTQREMEVLHLITEGMTNREIAEHLFISETTVKSHITSIFRKLGVSSRTQAAAQARSLNLFKPSDLRKSYLAFR
jgi:LuxR family maltose regulon positive regulatory protein